MCLCCTLNSSFSLSRKPTHTHTRAGLVPLSLLSGLHQFRFPPTHSLFFFFSVVVCGPFALISLRINQQEQQQQQRWRLERERNDTAARRADSNGATLRTEKTETIECVCVCAVQLFFLSFFGSFTLFYSEYSRQRWRQQGFKCFTARLYSSVSL